MLLPHTLPPGVVADGVPLDHHEIESFEDEDDHWRIMESANTQTPTMFAEFSEDVQGDGDFEPASSGQEENSLPDVSTEYIRINIVVRRNGTHGCVNRLFRI